MIYGTALTVLLLAVLSLPCAAAEQAQAKDIMLDSVTLSGSSDDRALMHDRDEATRVRFADSGSITLKSTEEIAALYLVWDTPPKSWQIRTPDGQVSMGEHRYLHQYAPLPDPRKNVTLTFEGAAVLCELRQLTDGAPPPEVQDWKAPPDKADLLLLPTHADDEHLYFGGTIPTYAAQGKSIQVAYMVNHNGEPYRQHELLNGLWTAGIRNYPIIPAFPDQYSPSLEHAKTIYDPAALLAYQVEQIRRFQPEVIVGHDINGEYGHGAHRLNAATLQQAVVAAADKTTHPESHKRYGAWDTKKTYLHLWAENPIVMNWDLPLPAFGGATAFETAEKAFARHTSQWEYFKVEQTGAYDCRKFGLWRTTVGTDVQGNDFFEHIQTD